MRSSHSKRTTHEFHKLNTMSFHEKKNLINSKEIITTIFSLNRQSKGRKMSLKKSIGIQKSISLSTILCVCLCILIQLHDHIISPIIAHSLNHQNTPELTLNEQYASNHPPLSSDGTFLHQLQGENVNININPNNNPDLENNSINNNNANSGRLNGNGISLNGGYPNRCAPGWMWYNNKCLVATTSRRDFAHAIELCRKMYNQSTLPTISNAAENDFLRQKINLKNSPIWLHARHNHQYNRTRWLDRSNSTYTNWDVGQPDDKASLVCIRTEDDWYMKKTQVKDGQAECVSFWEDGKWGTQVGCQVLLPVVCEKKIQPMARYQIQTNGSEPSFESINGGSLGHGAANSLNDHQCFNKLTPIISLFVTCVFYYIMSGQYKH